MLGIQQGRAAYGQDWTCRNLSVIPLGTKVMGASLRPWTLVQLLDAGAGTHPRIKGESLPLGKSGESPRVRHRIGLREDPSRR